MKSLPSRAFFVSDVHLRPRKHLARCTLDCGFKTPESPALRGFVGGPHALATAALYLVLKSNGFHHSENLPVKFVFSSKTVPANIAQKLPSQRCSQPFLIPLFNFSHKRPTFAFTVESGYTLAFANRIAHNGTHSETGGISDGGGITYPRTVSHVSETLRGRGLERQTLPLLSLGRRCSQRTQRACGTAMRLCASLSRRRRGPAGLRCSVCNLVMLLFFHSARRAFHTCKRGGGITTLGAFCIFSKRRTAACQSGSFAIFRGQVVIIDSSGAKCA